MAQIHVTGWGLAPGLSHQGQREHSEEDTIEVEGDRPIRRRSIEVVEGSSPSTRRVQTRARARGGGKVMTVRW
jgi:hypothetical protein